MRAALSPDDLKSGDLADVGWHPAEYVDYEEKSADTDGSTNCIFNFKLIDGPNKGLKVRRTVNEKPYPLSLAKGLWFVFFGPADPAKGYTSDQLNSEQFKGKIGTKLQVYIKRGKSEKGNDFNDVADFRPMQ